MARPFTKPVWSGATFGVIVWGLSHLETCAPDAHDIRFSIAEMVNPYLRYAKKKPAVGPGLYSRHAPSLLHQHRRSPTTEQS